AAITVHGRRSRACATVSPCSRRWRPFARRSRSPWPAAACSSDCTGCSTRRPVRSALWTKPECPRRCCTAISGGRTSSSPATATAPAPGSSIGTTWAWARRATTFRRSSTSRRSTIDRGCCAAIARRSSARATACRGIWSEGVDDAAGDSSVARRRRWRGRDVRECVAALKAHLGPYGLADALALYAIDGAPLPDDLAAAGLSLDAAADADLLLNLSHALPESVVRRFRRSAFVDTDPGLFQVWMTTGDICVAPHDVYFTIGETV